jgi:hypothetical protein
MAVSTETKLIKAKARIDVLLEQLGAARKVRMALITKMRGVVASRNTLERNLANAHGTVQKLEQQLTRFGLTPITQIK